jgi:hypothetical protein
LALVSCAKEQATDGPSTRPDARLGTFASGRIEPKPSFGFLKDAKQVNPDASPTDGTFPRKYSFNIRLAFLKVKPLVDSELGGANGWQSTTQPGGEKGAARYVSKGGWTRIESNDLPDEKQNTTYLLYNPDGALLQMMTVESGKWTSLDAGNNDPKWTKITITRLKD